MKEAFYDYIGSLFLCLSIGCGLGEVCVNDCEIAFRYFVFNYNILEFSNQLIFLE